jgi:hypothetical protein
LRLRARNFAKEEELAVVIFAFREKGLHRISRVCGKILPNSNGSDFTAAMPAFFAAFFGVFQDRERATREQATENREQRTENREQRAGSREWGVGSRE